MTATPTPRATQDAPEVPAGAAGVPRVSAPTFDAICRRADYDTQLDDATTFQMIALDSRDKDSTIADLERRLVSAEAVDSLSRHLLEAANARADALQVQLTAERERGDARWREGRNAAAEAVNAVLPFAGTALQREAQEAMRRACRVAVAALEPPAVPQEGDRG